MGIEVKIFKIIIYSEGNMNVNTKLHGNRPNSNSCGAISLETKNVNLILVLKVKSAGPRSL